MSQKIASMLVPSDAPATRGAFAQASHLSCADSFVDSHLVACAYLSKVAALSVVNTCIYPLFGLAQALDDLSCLRGRCALTSLKNAFTGMFQSIFLIVVCVVAIPFVFFLPHFIFISRSQEKEIAPPPPPPPLPPPPPQLPIIDDLQLMIPRREPRIFIDLRAFHVQENDIIAFLQRLPKIKPDSLIATPKLPRLGEIRLAENRKLILDFHQMGLSDRDIQQLISALTPQHDVVMVPRAASKQIPKGSMINYVTQYSPAYLPTYESLIEGGHRFYQMFTTTKKEDANSPENTIPLASRRSYLASFVWYMMALAQTNQGKGLSEGMFKFLDPGHRIHDFFASVATKRASTHFSELRGSSFGIDIVQDDVKGLPAQHQTVLFGTVKTLDSEQFSYLKPESWGTESWVQMLGHAVSYVMSRPATWFGWHQSGDVYKEHNPAMKAFAQLRKTLEEAHKRPVNYSWSLSGLFQYVRDCMIREKTPSILKFGFAGMTLYLRDYLRADPKSSHKESIRTFVDKYLSNFGDVSVRNGNEVIVTFDKQVNLNEPLIELLTLLGSSSPPNTAAARPLPPSEIDLKADY